MLVSFAQFFHDGVISSSRSFSAIPSTATSNSNISSLATLSCPLLARVSSVGLLPACALSLRGDRGILASLSDSFGHKFCFLGHRPSLT